MKKIVFTVVSLVLLSSCVSKKEFAALEAEKKKTEKELLATKTSLQKCLIEKEKEDTQMFALKEQVKYLQEDKKSALKQVENLTVLTQSSLSNIKILK